MGIFIKLADNEPFGCSKVVRINSLKGDYLWVIRGQLSALLVCWLKCPINPDRFVILITDRVDDECKAIRTHHF